MKTKKTKIKSKTGKYDRVQSRYLQTSKSAVNPDEPEKKKKKKRKKIGKSSTLNENNEDYSYVRSKIDTNRENAAILARRE